MSTDWDFPMAEREFRRAIELNPSYATAHQWYAYLDGDGTAGGGHGPGDRDREETRSPVGPDQHRPGVHALLLRQDRRSSQVGAGGSRDEPEVPAGLGRDPEADIHVEHGSVSGATPASRFRPEL